MKESSLQKVVSHIDKDEIVSKLVLGITPQEVNEWLNAKYGTLEGTKFIISVKILKDFKDNYLNLYQQIQNDAIQLHSSHLSVDEEAKDLVQNNSAYQQKLAEYIDKEIDLKKIMRNLIIIVESRLEQMYNIIQDNPHNFKPDYILVQYFNTLMTVTEKANTIINGSPDQMIQQNNINIQIVDQHLNVFFKVVRDILSKLDYETSLHFIDLYSEEMKKIKEVHSIEIPVDLRIEETKRLTSELAD